MKVGESLKDSAEYYRVRASELLHWASHHTQRCHLLQQLGWELLGWY
jgi:antirestriction protein ArdC